MQNDDLAAVRIVLKELQGHRRVQLIQGVMREGPVVQARDRKQEQLNLRSWIIGKDREMAQFPRFPSLYLTKPKLPSNRVS